MSLWIPLLPSKKLPGKIPSVIADDTEEMGETTFQL